MEQGISFISDGKKRKANYFQGSWFSSSHVLWCLNWRHIFLKSFCLQNIVLCFCSTYSHSLYCITHPVGGEVTRASYYCLSNHWGLHGRCYNALFILYWKTDFIICKNGPWSNFLPNNWVTLDKLGLSEYVSPSYKEEIMPYISNSNCKNWTWGKPSLIISYSVSV